MGVVARGSRSCSRESTHVEEVPSEFLCSGLPKDGLSTSEAGTSCQDPDAHGDSRSLSPEF